MLRIGFFKSVGPITKLLVIMVISGAIFNLGLMMSHKCNRTAHDVQEVTVFQLEPTKSRLAVATGGSKARARMHPFRQANPGGRTGTGISGVASPLKSPTGATGVHKALKDHFMNHGMESAMGNRFGVNVMSQGRARYQSHDAQNRHSLNDINATWVKEMISTMPTTKHVAPWGTHNVACRNRTYADRQDGKKASVIITFHENEKVSRILHTVHSILQRTPPHLLEEIILIDDHSKKEDLKEILQIYVSSVFGPKVTLRSNWLMKGLIGARLAGTRLAVGEVVVCMDSHMEVQDNWLEPLLLEIQLNPKTLAASYLDWMEYDTYMGTWQYRHGASTWKTYFDWTFTFGFQDISLSAKTHRSSVEPVPSPVTIGTIFAIDKQFFRDIGEFDDQMVGWGGENLDLPLRVWMFGGRVVNVPCSHVAHIEEFGQRNYRLGWDKDIVRNYRRVADVWLGDYRRHVYRYKPAMQDIDPGDLSSRYALQKKAVHDFPWFLEHVFPELGVPGQDVYAWGWLKNMGSKYCLYATPPNTPVIMDCVSKRPEKTEFSWSLTGELRFPLHAFSAVRGYAESALHTDEWMSYFNTSTLSKWIHWKRGPLLEWTSRRCLSTVKGTYRLLLSTCNFTSPYQQWEFTEYTASYTHLTGPTEVQTSNYNTKSFLRTLREASVLVQQGSWEPMYKLTYQPT